MTTIFIDCEKQLVFADKRANRTNGAKGKTEVFSVRKIRDADGSVLVGSGSLIEVDNFYESWIKSDELSVPSAAGTTVAVVKSDGNHTDVLLYESVRLKSWFGQKFKWQRSHYKKDYGYVSFGSGTDYAIGAYEAHQVRLGRLGGRHSLR